MEDIVRILLVDDDPRLQQAWRQLFALESGIDVVGALDRADELVQAALEKKPHVILLDLTMPGQDPFRAIGDLSRTNPQVRVIVCSGCGDNASVRRAIDAGAWGFVDKISEPAEIVRAVRLVADGEVALPAFMRNSR